MSERTEYLGCVVIRDGYCGDWQPLHLCRELNGDVWGVYSARSGICGYITYASPRFGIPPLMPE